MNNELIFLAIIVLLLAKWEYVVMLLAAPVVRVFLSRAKNTHPTTKQYVTFTD